MEVSVPNVSHHGAEQPLVVDVLLGRPDHLRQRRDRDAHVSGHRPTTRPRRTWRERMYTSVITDRYPGLEGQGVKGRTRQWSQTDNPA